MYMIQQTHDDSSIDFLNHSCLSTLSFGSPDMAWVTEDKEKAILMLFKVEATYRYNGTSFEVIEW